MSVPDVTDEPREFQGDVREETRALASELTQALIEQQRAYPDLVIVFLTDPVNTVYGGLEMGMALFFLFAALSPSLRTAGLLFALVLYGCLALWRIGTVLTIDGVGTFPYVMLAIEVTFTLIAAALYFRAS